ncbi:hypothetical protein AB7M47_002829 [Bradyrhizobium elkanii]
MRDCNDASRLQHPPRRMGPGLRRDDRCICGPFAVHPVHITRANLRKPGAPVIASKAASRFSSAKAKPALA